MNGFQRLMQSALVGMALIAVTHPAKAVVKEAGQFIQSLSDKAAQMLQKQNLPLEAREEMVRNLLNRRFSINEIGGEIFGSQWAKIENDQQSDFLKQFREWVLKAYATCLGGYKGQAFEILKIDGAGTKGVMVRNKVSLAGGGGSFKCDWRVSRDSGKYKILDIGFEGSNLRRNQKRLFSNTIRLHGVVGLTELLKMRNSKLPVVGGAFEAGTVAYQKTDFLAAMSIWKPLAESGDARAQYNMGVLHDQGQGVARDKKKAREWWEKSANQNFPKALHNLASSYFLSEGQHDRAMGWLSRSARLGVSRSQYSLGKVYLHAHGGVQKDDAKARKWIEKSALQGFDRAQYNMGKITRDGIGGPKDIAAAVQWFLKAAKQGYAKSQRNIGKLYLTGVGVKKNGPKALFWLTLAANQGELTFEKERKALQKKLFKDDVAKVERSVKAWKPE